MIRDWIDILRWVGLVGWITFVPMYHVRTRGAWRRSEAGRWIMTLACTPLLFLALGVSVLVFGMAYPGLDLARFVVYSVLVVLPAWLIRLLFTARTREESNR